MLSLRRSPLLPSPSLSRSFIDVRVPWVRDRALDHAVEKEKHLLPFHNVKSLLLSSPTPSLPLSSFSSPLLSLPFRPIRFLRLFPSAFLESPCPQTSRPLISPSTLLLRLHDEEIQTLNSTAVKSDSADRLLRLLMLCPNRRLPLQIIDRLRFDLGLPADYVQSLLPDFPDYFSINNSLELELVCYSRDLAVSSLKRQGFETSFPLSFPRGFTMDKNVRAWLDKFQKLPYVSPYEIGSRLPPNSEVKEKWAVGMVHEVLSLMVPKKTEKENLRLLGTHLGLSAGFRKMIMNYPGIFYLSNKLKTQTVVLREAYKRDLLAEKHPLMGLRYQYIHLMHRGREGTAENKKGKKKKSKRGDGQDVDEEEYDDEEDDDEDDDEEEGNAEEDDKDDSEDDESEDEESDDDEEEDDCETTEERTVWRSPMEVRSFQRTPQNNSSRRNEAQKQQNGRGKPRGRASSSRVGQRSSSGRRKVAT